MRDWDPIDPDPFGRLGLRSQGTPPADHDFWYGPVGEESSSGVRVTPDGALRVAAVFACVRLLANTIASLPLLLYRRTADDGKEKARDRPLWGVLHSRPNDWQTAFEFRQMLQGHLSLRGNAYAEILPGPRGAVDRLVPLHPDRVEPMRLENGRVGYDVLLPDGTGKRRLTQDQVFHLRGYSSDGVVGLSPIGLARESIGSSIAQDNYGGSLFKNSARPGGVLRHPGKLKPEARQNLKASWHAAHSGGGVGSTAVLEEGMDWTPLGMTPTDAQWLESRKFSRGEIAMIFGVPPHMIGDVERSTSWGTGIEEQGLGFVTYTLLSWLTLWEQAADRDLVSDPDTYFVKFQVAGLHRGDIGKRYSAYQIGRQGGWLSVNDVRRLEDMNPIEGGDEYLSPLNMTPAGQRDDPPDEDDDEPPARQAAGAPREALAVLLTDAADRLAAAELRELEKRADKAAADPARWSAWLAEFYAAHEKYAAKVLRPIADAWALQSGDRPDPDAVAHALASGAVLALSGGDPASVVAGWKATRAADLAALFLEGFICTSTS